MSVLYEFGYGLSYTTFSISKDTQVETMFASPLSALPTSAKTLPGGNPHLWDVLYRLSTTVTNTGSVTGYAVPQLYLTIPRGSTEGFVAKNILRGFEKLQLKPGESRRVAFNLTRRDLSNWDTVKQQWAISHGEFLAHVGFSSRDFRASVPFVPIH
jgi:beta-glucosidase